MFKRSFLLTIIVSSIITSCSKDKLETEEPKEEPQKNACDTVTFKGHIEPIISANCAMSGCHVAGFGPGDFTSYSGVKSKADDGKLEQRVLIDKNMPPAGALPQDELDKIQCWLNNGAPNN